MRTFLVTGGAGFIGSNFIIHMLKNYENLQILNLDKLTYAGNLENLKSVDFLNNYKFIEGDICDKNLLNSIFSQYSINYVVNFAAESHVDRSIKNPEIFVETNVLGTATLLNAAKKAWENPISKNGFKDDVKFLQISTDEVYGSLSSEGFFVETTNVNPRSPYSASKAAADFLVSSYFSTYGLPINITRCSNNYGPFQFPEKLIPLTINNILNHRDIPVYGDGLNIRDWLYVIDHCRAIDLVLKKGKVGEIYNIGGCNEKTNLSLIQTIISILEKLKNIKITSKIKYVADRKGHDRRYAINPAKIERELGFKPTVSFETGIEQTIKWFLNNDLWLKNVVSGAYKNYYESMYGN